jgi:hypothetical protein
MICCKDTHWLSSGILWLPKSSACAGLTRQTARTSLRISVCKQPLWALLPLNQSSVYDVLGAAIRAAELRIRREGHFRSTPVSVDQTGREPSRPAMIQKIRPKKNEWGRWSRKQWRKTAYVASDWDGSQQANAVCAFEKSIVKCCR